jgi:hypothetical protein
LGNGSILTDRSLWTLHNLQDLVVRQVDNPILGTNRDFLDKLRQQLQTAPPGDDTARCRGSVVSSSLPQQQHIEARHQA